MEDTLIIEDTLLYIAIGLITFGMGIIATAFWQGIVSLAVGALVVIARILLKKKGVVKIKNEILELRESAGTVKNK